MGVESRRGRAGSRAAYPSSKNEQKRCAGLRGCWPGKLSPEFLNPPSKCCAVDHDLSGNRCGITLAVTAKNRRDLLAVGYERAIRLIFGKAFKTRRTHVSYRRQDFAGCVARQTVEVSNHVHLVVITVAMCDIEPGTSG
jgi:hypothetical protein